LRLFGADHAGQAPKAALAHGRARARLVYAAGDDPQRDRVSGVPPGEAADEVGDLGGEADGDVDVGVRAGGVGDVHHVTGVGGVGAVVARGEQALAHRARDVTVAEYRDRRGIGLWGSLVGRA